MAKKIACPTLRSGGLHFRSAKKVFCLTIFCYSDSALGGEEYCLDDYYLFTFSCFSGLKAQLN